MQQERSLFSGPPTIPSSLTDTVKYKLESRQWFNRLKSLIWIMLEIISALFVIGLLWITVDWIRLSVTIIAIILALFLLYLVTKILY